MQVSKITRGQWMEILKALLYVTVSSIISYAITLLTENPDFFGAYTVLVNGLLVAIKKLFTEDK